MKKHRVDPGWTTTLSGGSGDTVLHTCARWGHVEMCRDLLKSGWCINATNAMKQTPLSLACREGFPRVVRLLLKGSKSNGGFPKFLVRDVTGHGCLGYARKGAERESKKMRGCAKCVELLEAEWERRQAKRRRAKAKRRRAEAKAEWEDDEEDEEEEEEESDSDPESSVYEEFDLGMDDDEEEGGMMW